MGALRPGPGGARFSSGKPYAGRGPWPVKDARKDEEELDRIPWEGSRQEQGGRRFCELYLGSTEGGLCIGSGTGEYYFLVPVTEVLAGIAAERQSTALHLSGVELEMDLFHKGAVDFFATLVKVPVAGLQNIEVNAKNRLFQLGTSATQMPEAARPRTLDDPTVTRIFEHAYEDHAADGTLFGARMKSVVLSDGEGWVNGSFRAEHWGRFGDLLAGRGDGSVSASTSEVKDSIQIYWEPREKFPVRYDPGNAMVRDRYMILIGVRPRNSRGVVRVNWLTAKYHCHE